MPCCPILDPNVFFSRCHMSSEFMGRAMNKEDALRRLPRVCTTVVAMATDFM